MTSPALPVTIVGGYLGAGKTTLVNHVLRRSGLRIAVLVNEFGALPIDRDLIEAEDDALIAIAGGCVCCEFGEDLTGALARVLRMSPRPEHVLLECSGVALPGAILTSLIFVDGVRADGVVVVADAAEIRRTGANRYLADTIDRQLREADIVLLNKADLVGEADLAAVAGWLRARAPGAGIVPAVRAEAPCEALLGAGPHLPRDDPRPGHAESLFRSLVLLPPAGTDPATLARALAGREIGLVRAKGYVERPGGGMSLIQLVGRRWTVETVDDAHEPGVVCIGLKSEFSPEMLKRLGAVKTH